MVFDRTKLADHKIWLLTRFIFNFFLVETAYSDISIPYTTHLFKTKSQSSPQSPQLFRKHENTFKNGERQCWCYSFEPGPTEGWDEVIITSVKSFSRIDCWQFCPHYYYCCNYWPGRNDQTGGWEFVPAVITDSMWPVEMIEIWPLEPGYYATRHWLDTQRSHGKLSFIGDDLPVCRLFIVPILKLSSGPAIVSGPSDKYASRLACILILFHPPPSSPPRSAALPLPPDGWRHPRLSRYIVSVFLHD